MSRGLTGFSASFDEALPLLFRRIPVGAFGDEGFGSGCRPDDLADHLVMAFGDLRDQLYTPT